MFRRKRFTNLDDIGLVRSELFNEQSFYPAFMADAKRASSSIIIESPFISYKRLNCLYPLLQNTAHRGVRIIVNTRDPLFQDDFLRQASANGVVALQDLGVEVLFTSNHHRKLAIIDEQILWEGSLNILSQGDSCEVMRRIESPDLVRQMVQFTSLEKWYTK